MGILRSFDQYANIVLEETIERIYVGELYGDIPLGVFIIRGENLVLLGEIDETRETKLQLKKVSARDITEAFKTEQQIREEQNKLKRKILLDRGLSGDNGMDDFN